MRKFEFAVDAASKEKLAGLKIGWSYFSGVENSKSNPSVDLEVSNTCKAVAEKFSDLNKILEDEVVKGMRNISAQTASVIATLEPVYGIVAALLLGEIPELRTIIGGVVILGATAYATLKSGQQN